MKTRILVAAVLSATMGITMASVSYADVDGSVVTSNTTSVATTGSGATATGSMSTNAATPAVPATNGSAATPAVPGNPTAREAYERSELAHQHDRLVDLAQARARLATLKTLLAQSVAAQQTEKAERIRAHIHRLRLRIDTIRDHVQHFRAVELSEHAKAGTTVVVADKDAVHVDRPHIDRPHIAHPEIDRPEITRPEITRPVINHPVIER